MLDKQIIQERDTSTTRRTADAPIHWWLDAEDKQHEAMWSLVDSIKQRQRSRWLLNLTYASLYENIARIGLGPRALMVGFRAPGGGVTQTETLGSSNKSAHNVIRSCVNTCAARIAKEEPRVRFTTTRGNWSDQQRAKKLSIYMDGVFTESGAYKACAKAFLDALVFDAGFVLPYVEPGSNRIKVERVVPLEPIVDDDDGLHGNPRQLCREKEMPREVLLAAYPEKRSDLEHTPNLPATTVNASDNVLVREAWHLPSIPGAKDGRHVIAVQNCTLLSEPYERDYFPIIKITFQDRVSGYWGMGLCEELAGMQLRLNKLDKQIMAAQQFACVPRVFVEAGSNVDRHQLFDFGVVKYTGTPPQFNTAPGMPSEIYQERNAVIDRMYELSGVSQLAASAQKPGGLNSGAALEEFADQTSERFSLQGKRYEEMFVELARHIIDMSRELYKSDKGLKSNGRGRRGKFIQSIKWADCNLDDDAFLMRADPVSQLPQTPPKRFAFIKELLQAGFIDQETAQELMSFLDVEDEMSIATAAYDCAMHFIERALDGENDQPEPFWNLALTLRLAQASYLRAQAESATEEQLEPLRRFIELVKTESDRIAAEQQAKAAPPAPAPAAGAPIAAPPPPPTSDMLPIGATT